MEGKGGILIVALANMSGKEAKKIREILKKGFYAEISNSQLNEYEKFIYNLRDYFYDDVSLSFLNGQIKEIEGIRFWRTIEDN